MVRFGLIFGVAVAVTVFIFGVAVSAPPPARPPSPYFEAGSLRSNPDADASYNEWYTTLLDGMRMPNAPGIPSQPALDHPPANAKKHSEEYRALISYDREYLIAIRMFSDPPSTPELVGNVVDTRTGENRAFRRMLEGDTFASLRDRIRAGGFFKNGRHEPAHFKGECPDWVIEVRAGTQYEMLSTSCTRDPKLLAIQSAILDAAQLRPY